MFNVLCAFVCINFTTQARILTALVATAGSQSVFVDNTGGHGVVRLSHTGLPLHGGTTATVVVLSRLAATGNRFIICANVGDSDALLVANDGHKGT